MPTPGGKPRAGDRLRHRETGATVTVVKREGNDMLYSLILKLDKPYPKPMPQQAYGYPRGHFRLLEAGYWIPRFWEYI